MDDVFKNVLDWISIYMKHEEKHHEWPTSENDNLTPPITSRIDSSGVLIAFFWVGFYSLHM